jgi:hypothetical protein
MVMIMQITVLWERGTVQFGGKVTTSGRKLLPLAVGKNSEPEQKGRYRYGKGRNVSRGCKQTNGSDGPVVLQMVVWRETARKNVSPGKSILKKTMDIPITMYAHNWV